MLFNFTQQEADIRAPLMQSFPLTCSATVNIRRMRIFMKVATLPSILILFVECQAQTADDILKKYFASIGGVEKWKELKSIHYTGRIINRIVEMEYPISIYQKPKNKVKFISSLPGNEYISCYDDTIAWKKNNQFCVKLDEEDEQQQQLGEWYFEDAFIDYKKKEHQVTLLGREEVDGILCYKIFLGINGGGEIKKEFYYFHPESYRKIMKVRFLKIDGSKDVQVNSYYGNFREVNGLYFPFVTEVKNNVQLVQKRVIDKIALDELIEDSFFSYPSE